MKTPIIACLAFLFPIVLSAQEPFSGEIRWGEPQVLKKREWGPDPIGVADGAFYAMKGRRKEAFMQIYDMQTLSVKQEDLVDMNYNGNELTRSESFVFNDMPVFISYYRDEAADKKIYLLHELSGGKVNHAVVLAEVDDSKARKRTMRQYNNGSKFGFVVSGDKQSLMVMFRDEVTKDDAEEEASKMNTVLFDKDLSEVTRGVLELKDFRTESMRLSNDGRLFIVGFDAIYGESKGIIKRDIVTNGDCHMLVYDGSNTEKIKLDISKTIHSVALKLFDDGSSVVYGMYSNPNANGVSGAFFVKLNSELNVGFTTTEEFEENFVTQFWSERAKKKSEKRQEKGKANSEPALYSYVMHDLAIKENGEMTLLAEQYYMYVTTTTTTDANGRSHTTYTYHYVYNDIVAVNCTPEGDVTWKQLIMKRQHTINDGGYYSSFFTMVQGNSIFLLYNDKEANMEETDMDEKSVRDKRKARRNTVAAIINLNESGEANRKVLFDFEEDTSRILIPKRCEKMSANEILLYTNAAHNTKILGWVTL